MYDLEKEVENEDLETFSHLCTYRLYALRWRSVRFVEYIREKGYEGTERALYCGGYLAVERSGY